MFKIVRQYNRPEYCKRITIRENLSLDEANDYIATQGRHFCKRWFNYIEAM